MHCFLPLVTLPSLIPRSFIPYCFLSFLCFCYLVRPFVMWNCTMALHYQIHHYCPSDTNERIHTLSARELWSSIIPSRSFTISAFLCRIHGDGIVYGMRRRNCTSDGRRQNIEDKRDQFRISPPSSWYVAGFCGSKEVFADVCFVFLDSRIQRRVQKTSKRDLSP